MQVARVSVAAPSLARVSDAASVVLGTDAAAPVSTVSDTVAVSQAAQASPAPDPAAEPQTAVTAALAGIAGGSVVAAGMFAGLKDGFVTRYLSPAECYARAKKLAKEHPDLVTLVERPYRTHGYDGSRKDLAGPAPLWYLRIGHGQDRDKRVGVLHAAAPHAREWIQPMIVTELAEELVHNYDPRSANPGVRASSKLLDEVDVYLVPVTNPDGMNYSLYDEDMWRKNRRDNGDGTFGVDVNRNFGYRFASEAPTEDECYAGPRAGSEPETRHVAQIVEEHPNIRFTADWHSFGEEVRRPWGVSEKDRPFYERFQGRMRDAIASVRGRQYAVADSRVVNGASDDYFYQAKGLFSSIIEDATDFHPDEKEAVQVMRECVAGARELLVVAAEYGRTQGLAKASPPEVKPPDPSPEA